MIQGVREKKLKQIADERGKVMHMLRADDPEFEEFGEIYFSGVNPQIVKGWHIHTKMTLNYAVIHGKIKLVLFDEREDSPTKGETNEFILGPDENYSLITVPPMVWNGFQGLGDEMSIVANCATIPHDPNEIQRWDPRDDQRIPYKWEIHDDGISR